MITLSNLEKERIGKLLKYYRKKNKVQWKEIEKICSSSTYSNIEKGKTIKRDEIYYELLKLYNLSYEIKPNFDIWLKKYLIQMNRILESYEEEQFDLLINELEKELELYSTRVVYKQYYQIIMHILNYYKYSKYMSIEEIEDCLELFESFEFEEMIIVYLIEVMFISNSNLHHDYYVNEKLISHSKEINHPILLYHFGFYYVRKNMFDTALKYFEKSISYWQNTVNDYRYVQSLIGEFVIYKNIDKTKAIVMIDKFSQLKNEGKINNSIIPRLNYNIAMFYYLENDYDKALPYFYEDVKSYGEIDEMIFICAICTQINTSLPNLINQISIVDHPHKIYLNYFRLKYLGESKVNLVNYIFQNVIPNKLAHQIYVQPFWNIFEEELLEFCKEDKRYAFKLLEFIEKKKKYCKKV